MKRRITIRLNGKKTSGEVELRNTLHFDVQRNTRSNTFRDRTKYTRKIKHKNRDTRYYDLRLKQKEAFIYMVK